ncbi:MAG: hypothetical protein ACRDOI_39700 [Trebonia sp.]
MDGYLMYEVARQRIADQHRAAERRQAARQATAARKERAAARGRRAGREVPAPAIPDFADELLDTMARGSVPGPRQEAGHGRRTRSSR